MIKDNKDQHLKSPKLKIIEADASLVIENNISLIQINDQLIILGTYQPMAFWGAWTKVKILLLIGAWDITKIHIQWKLSHELSSAS